MVTIEAAEILGVQNELGKYREGEKS